MKQKNSNVKKIIPNKILLNLKNQRISKVFKSFSNNLNIKTKYAVAVSGGADSLSLAFFAQCLALIKKIEIKFYTVDHKLRKQSNLEAKQTIKLLKDHGIKCKILSWNGIKPRTNIQALARKKRYSLLTNQCKKDKINYLLLGHHVDDLYENFFIRLCRGSGLKGLTSFKKISDYDENSIKLLRPLLNIEKKELIFTSNKVFNFFIKDPSNKDINFKRIRFRNLMTSLKQEGLDEKKFLLTINNLKDSDKTINFYVKKNLEQNTFFLDKKMCILNSSFFKNPHEVVFRSLSNLLKIIGKKYYPVRGKSIENLLLKIKQNKGRKFTLGGCYIEKVNESVLISIEK